MTTLSFTFVFLFALNASVLLKLWLSIRQSRHVARHRAQVPPIFAERISLFAHQRAADYTLARQRLGVVELMIGTTFLLWLTLLGGLQWLHELMLSALPDASFWRQLLLVMLVGVLSAAIELPIALYRQLVLEERFGFNRMTLRLFALDTLKGTLVAGALGIPLLAMVLWLMQQAGAQWWLWAWLVWVGFNLFVLVFYPTVIAPLFNKFEPLADNAVRERVEHLMTRCGFAAKGLFVMDGSRRSAHGNAYFTGLGRSKRIVFFDTLLARLSLSELEAVLAHELGHFHHRHILKRILFSFVGSLAGLALLGWLSRQPWFYHGLGVAPDPTDWPALVLVLFFSVLPTFTFLLQPLMARLSRRHEFQADAYAATQAPATELINALVKLYEDNASTLTPDPVHSAFYDSHPPASQRIARLAGLVRGSAAPAPTTA